MSKGKGKGYHTYYELAYGTCIKIRLRKILSPNGKVIYRDEMGMTKSAKFIKTWDELSYDQKVTYYRQEYEDTLEAAEWAFAKDPSLEVFREKWAANALRIFNRNVEALSKDNMEAQK